MSSRADRCTACGRPTYVGEDFGGPCVHDTDLACAMAQRDELQARLAGIAAWLRRGDPCASGGVIYGPYQDACDMLAAAIERGEP